MIKSFAWFLLIDLKSSSIYSYETCVTQCRMDHIYKFCNCVPFYYLHSKDLMRTLRPQNGSSGCQCLPRCTDSWYKTDCVTAQLANADFTTSSFMHRANTSTSGIISVSWADTLSTKYTRDVSLTWDTFFGSFGGILSLCVGGSVLSVVELLYFMLIRTCTACRWRRGGGAGGAGGGRGGRRRKPPRKPRLRRQPTLQLFWAEFTQNMLARSKK